jgi:anti-sigma factor RsiW
MTAPPTLSRVQVLELLPCYLCGDLPTHINLAIESMLETDTDLGERLATLRTSRDLCKELLEQRAPELLADPPSQPAPAPLAPVSPPTRATGLVLGVAAAAIVLLAMGSVGQRAPAGEEVGALHTLVSTDDAALIRAESPQALTAALQAAGVSPQLAMAPDLSEMGFQMVGARVLGPHLGTAPGVAVIYEKDGERYVCQIQLVRPTHGLPDDTTEAAGTVLRAYKSENGAVVSWFGGGRWCVFGGPASPEALLAMVGQRITSG